MKTSPLRLPICFLAGLLPLAGSMAWSAADAPAPAPAAQQGSREERLQDVLKRHPEADLNHDGTLSADEARQAIQTIRGGKGAGGGAKSPATQPTAGDAAPVPAAGADRAKRMKASASRLPKPDFADVSYGDHPNDKFDLWLAKADGPTPLIVFIHGGGFVGGDKSSASASALQECLDAGVSFASINYRFRTTASINTVLRDPARAIQFFRSKAGEYHLDKARIATFGGSAGAGTSLWLAFHDDLADPKSDDPVSRESTRIVAAGATGCQATYDILKWQDVLGSEEALRFSPKSEWPHFYGLESWEDLQSEKGKALRADADMLGMISKDDPPVWLSSSDSHAGFATKGDVNHNPKHAEAVKKRCDEIGVPCAIQIGGKGAAGEAESQMAFLIKAVKREPK